MAVYQNPELLSLFDVYTGGPTSIGADLTRMTMQAASDDPLIVVTKTDMALFPGGGAAPSVVVARAANAEEVWRESIAAEAYKGREKTIAAMIDYACAVTVRYLKTVLADDAKLTSELDFLQIFQPLSSYEAAKASVSTRRSKRARGI